MNVRVDLRTPSDKWARIGGIAIVACSVVIAARFPTVLEQTYPIPVPTHAGWRYVAAQGALALLALCIGGFRLRVLPLAGAAVCVAGLVFIEEYTAAQQALAPNVLFVRQVAAAAAAAAAVSLGVSLCGIRAATTAAAVTIAALAAICMPALLKLVPSLIADYNPLQSRPTWESVNSFSYVCAAGCALALTVVLQQSRSNRAWVIGTSCAAASGSVLLLARSRGAVLVLGLVVAVHAGVLVVRWLRAPGHPARWAAAGLAALLMAVAGLQFAVSEAGHGMLARQSVNDPGDMARESRKLSQSIDQRTESWGRALELYEAAPFLGNSYALVSTEQVKGRGLHTWHGRMMAAYGFAGAALLAWFLGIWLVCAQRWYATPLLCAAGLAAVALSVRPDLEPIIGVMLALGAPPLAIGARIDLASCAASPASSIPRGARPIPSSC